MNAPYDWKSPDWENVSRVHDWRNYATIELRQHWKNMDDETKKIVSACLDYAASLEEWD